MNLAALKNGNTIQFSNEDGTLTAEVTLVEGSIRESSNGFKIWFNGSLVHSSKTIKPLEKKLGTLCKEHHLELIGND